MQSFMHNTLTTPNQIVINVYEKIYLFLDAKKEEEKKRLILNHKKNRVSFGKREKNQRNKIHFSTFCPPLGKT